MSNEKEKPTYVGSAKEIRISGRDSSGMKIELDLDALWAFVNDPANKEHVRTWTGRDGKKHRSLNLAAWPLKDEHVTDRKTHSVKVDTWKPDPAKRKEQQSEHATSTRPKQEPGRNAHDVSDDNLPF